MRIRWSEIVVYVNNPRMTNAANAIDNRLTGSLANSRSGFRRPDSRRKSWCTGKDSNLRTSLGGTDLQSVGFNHSPTCAETAQASAPNRERSRPDSPLRGCTNAEWPCRLRYSENQEWRAHTRARKNHYTSEKFLMECVGKLALLKLLPLSCRIIVPGAGEGI
jgi:hypothetical protein